MAASKLAGHQFTVVVILFTIVFLVLFGLFGRYSAETYPLAVSEFSNVSRTAPRK
jgi:hypothetical protein